MPDWPSQRREHGGGSFSVVGASDGPASSALVWHSIVSSGHWTPQGRQTNNRTKSGLAAAHGRRQESRNSACGLSRLPSRRWSLDLLVHFPLAIRFIQDKM